MIPFIDLKTQYAALREPIEARMSAVLKHGQFIMGPEVEELEGKLAAFTGSKFCVSASSGTDTLLIALMALGAGPGDEVITTPFSFIATAETIALAGAKPVFVDIEADSFNIDPAKIDAAITPRTKAIMPVSLYGQCADFDVINAIAARHKLPVIEDAAQSFGATYKGKRSCAATAIGSTSFFPSKPLGCYGDGGALFTDDAALAKAMREIRAHGQDRRYHHPRLGINGRLDTLQAAVLLAKLPRFDWEVARRAEIGARYSALIAAFAPGADQPGAAEAVMMGRAGAPRLAVPHIRAGNTSVFAQYTIVVPNRDAVLEALKARNIPTAIHYPTPLHLQPVFESAGVRAGTMPVAEAAARCVFSLPMGPDLTEADQDSVVAALREAIGAAG